MKTILISLILTSIVALRSTSVNAQSAFQNLNFEAAQVSGSGGVVSTSSALPDWSVFYGSTQQTQMGYNLVSLGTVNVTLLNAANGAIDGNYSVFLQGGEGNGGPASASISQTGLIPVGMQTLFFEGNGYGPLDVLVGNQSVSFSAVGSGANYTLYAADISAWAGDTELLTFLAPSSGGLNDWELDDISFSAVPEPSMVALSAIGGLLFGARKWLARRC
jgi:hypothetical protein